MSTGGYRPGAGRKKGTPASNRKYATEAETKVVRVPVGFDEVAAVSNIEQLRVLVETWQSQADEAAQVSKTGTTPRTYDKALLLLEELRQMLKHSEQQ
ncbi:hypothetical protein Ava_3097 [Trichormus variabilis ATCC 29413]|uniref:Uncharacterized protein n=2 Tax=Anabaena variabilis TaxID=264691 RepID=Q3M8I0_TRIV2|nr:MULTISPECIES: hypothetical protein [Nostocaceae]ABA22706.1 hypothetical protein Ava_3097 [Trichormus variabilis ATCC 29413]MBC1215055.1 hypothetical protein [Trichormus variabilis ARAD]MBC1254977.1 hypothetical protein [Trichormus variabilis V5]MBC1267956.1 hypothetical protein [Trichormus variabilis FSR]MBC1303725.1 hypothetical protein [Trichormus variabilis N2B]